MTDFERISALAEALGYKSLRAFAIALEIKVQTFYDIQAGRCRLSSRVVGRINEKFSNVSAAWLLTGEGEMLKHPTDQNKNLNSITGNGNVTVHGNENNVNQISEFISLLAKKDEQMDRLITIIEKLSNER